MRKRLMLVLLSITVLVLCATVGLADKSDGDTYTFCPAMSMSLYNSMIKNLLDLSDAQASLIQVSSDGVKDGNVVYSNAMQDTIFIFGGTTSEYGTASTAYIYCSLKDSSTLKNIPMLVWASCIEMKYYGEIKETGSTFLEWVNEERRDGETFTTPYFIALYKEEPRDNCSLLLTIADNTNVPQQNAEVNATEKSSNVSQIDSFSLWHKIQLGDSVATVKEKLQEEYLFTEGLEKDDEDSDYEYLGYMGDVAANSAMVNLYFDKRQELVEVAYNFYSIDPESGYAELKNNLIKKYGDPFSGTGSDSNRLSHIKYKLDHIGTSTSYGKNAKTYHYDEWLVECNGEYYKIEMISYGYDVNTATGQRTVTFVEIIYSHAPANMVNSTQATPEPEAEKRDPLDDL